MSRYTTIQGDEIKTVLSQLKSSSQEEKLPITFICEFENGVEPKELIEIVFNPNEKYNSIGFDHKLREGDEYYSISSVIGLKNGSGEKMNFELSPEWMRVYISGDEDLEKVSSFFTKLHLEFQFSIVVAESYLQ